MVDKVTDYNILLPDPGRRADTRGQARLGPDLASPLPTNGNTKDIRSKFVTYGVIIISG